MGQPTGAAKSWEEMDAAVETKVETTEVKADEATDKCAGCAGCCEKEESK